MKEKLIKYDFSKPITTLKEANMLFLILELDVNTSCDSNNREFIARIERTRITAYNRQQSPCDEKEHIETIDQAMKFQKEHCITVRCHDLNGKQFVRLMEDIRFMEKK